MAFTIIASTSIGSPDGATSLTTSAIDTTGATGIFIIAVDYPGLGLSVSDNKGNGAPTDVGLNPATGIMSTRMFYYVAPIVGAGHTFTLNSYVPSLAVLAVSGMKSASPFDQSNSSQQAGAHLSQQPGSVTPTEANEIVITGGGFVTNHTPVASIGSGFSLAAFTTYASGFHNGCAIAYKIQTTAGAENPTWSWTDGSDCCLIIASFRTPPAAAVLMAQERSLMRRIGGRLFGRVN